MKVLNRITLWVFIVVFLSGCTAFQLRDANNLLVDLYSAKMELEQKKYAPDEKLMLLANINEGLIQLAEDAAKEAQKRETKKLNKIAFYRIAATAAWQAMNTASDDDKKKEARKRILEYAAEGKSKCGNANDAPRDCGMLLIIPTLAGIDEHGSIHKKVSDEIDEKKAKNEEVIKLFDDEINALRILINNYKETAKTDVHPKFLEKVRAIMKKDYCQRVNDALLLLVRQLKESSDIYKKKAEEDKKIKKILIDEGIEESALNCL